MSIPQSQIKGSITLASDAGATITIGNNTGTTTIIGTTINIENETQIDNLAQIRIGATTGAFNSNTTLSGLTTISKPTIGRPISFTPTFTAPIAGQMFFNNRVTTGGFFTGTTTMKAFAPVNNLTEGVYLLLGFVYLSASAPITRVQSSLVYSGSAIANDQASGFTIINDNTFEAYGYKATTGTTGGNWTMNLSTVYTVLPSPNNNIALGILTGVSATGVYADIKYCRLA